MSARRVLIYGVTGYTGALVAEHALASGLEVVCAGRDEARTAAAAQRLAAPFTVVDLTDTAALRRALDDVDIVAHCAGPYERTAAPMIDACLHTGTHYLDLTGEAAVFDAVYARHEEAVEAGVTLVPGVGFDVVPTDHLVAAASALLPSATTADIAVVSRGGFSRGTLATVVLGLSAGNRVRRNGRIEPVPHGHRTMTVDLPRGKRASVASSPLGDLSSAVRTAGLRDVTTFAAVPAARSLRRLDRPLRALLALPGVVPRLECLLMRVPGPSSNARSSSRSAGWVRLSDEDGRSIVRSIEVDNTYTFTARSMVHAAVLLGAGGIPTGSHTPSSAFGANFVHDIPDVQVTGAGRIPEPTR
ncbi:saccharopine dehydrogenase family protein [Rhodococcoides kroppenstedtii]|uniref:saccharopine dehydrogenase family protein n=1 Tax=Rhodococcoides kroppenstedtii TaxID=293050 RepID=UPI0021BF4CB6|nr:saccharopine dehydrogenase NADP-binding domain-containing protein [Rhodococcus kroppenstedtii]